MKKSVTLFSCIILCSSIAYTQKLIPKAGATFSVMSSDSDTPRYPTSGLLIGAGIEFPLTSIISVQPELLFQQKGYVNRGTVSGTFSGAEYDYTYTLNYVELPVVIKFSFGKFYVNAGPSFSYGLSGKFKRELTDQDGTVKTSRKIKFGTKPEGYTGTDLYFKNPLDVGLQVGGGIKPVKFLIIDVRFGLGLLDVREVESKNRSLQISAGIPINLGKSK